MSNVLGIDLSLTSTGLAEFVDGELWVDRIRTTGKKTDDLLARKRRLSTIVCDIGSRVDEGSDDLDLVVIEAPSFASQHGSAHDRSGLWWMIVDLLLDFELPVALVSPNGRAKYATGKGNADKQTVFNAACTTYGEHEAMQEVVKLGWRQGNDMADAVVLAAMGARFLGEPVEDTLSTAQCQAYDAVDWPQAAAA